MNKKILFTLMLAVMPASQSIQASDEGCGCFSMASLLWNKITNKQKKQPLESNGSIDSNSNELKNIYMKDGVDTNHRN